MARSFTDAGLHRFLDTLERVEDLVFYFSVVPWPRWDEFLAWADNEPAAYLARQNRSPAGILLASVIATSPCPPSLSAFSTPMPASKAAQFFRMLIDLPANDVSVLVSEDFATLMS